MEQKIRTGQRVQLAKHDSRVLRGAVGIICDNDSDARFPLVKWMDRSMIASEVRLRGNSPQARTISVDKIRLELLEDKRRYPINSHVVLVDETQIGTAEEFDDWWVSAHCIDLADKQPLINKVKSETIKHEEDGFSKEVTFFY